MPRKAKPPAEPIEMPRTEDDLDILMRAIEAHMGHSHRLGELYRDNKLTAEEVLVQAGESDEKLYNILDTVQIEREAEVRQAESANS